MKLGFSFGSIACYGVFFLHLAWSSCCSFVLTQRVVELHCVSLTTASKATKTLAFSMQIL